MQSDACHPDAVSRSPAQRMQNPGGIVDKFRKCEVSSGYRGRGVFRRDTFT